MTCATLGTGWARTRHPWKRSNSYYEGSVKLNFGARSFRVAAPTVWNSLPADIRACTFYGSFIRQLKTFYFNNAF